VSNETPAPSARVYYRSSRTGDLGFMVTREGVDAIQLDRPNEEILRPFTVAEWQPEQASSGMSRVQMAHVAFAADCALCRCMGEHDLAKRDWLSMREEARIKFSERGPSGGVRKRVFDAILGVLMEAKCLE